MCVWGVTADKLPTVSHVGAVHQLTRTSSLPLPAVWQDSAATPGKLSKRTKVPTSSNFLMPVALSWMLTEISWKLGTIPLLDPHSRNSNLICLCGAWAAAKVESHCLVPTSVKMNKEMSFKMQANSPEGGALTHYHLLRLTDSKQKQLTFILLDRKKLTLLLQQKEERFSPCLATVAANGKSLHFKFQVSSNAHFVHNSPFQLLPALYVRMLLSFVLQTLS